LKKKKLTVNREDIGHCNMNVVLRNCGDWRMEFADWSRSDTRYAPKKDEHHKHAMLCSSTILVGLAKHACSFLALVSFWNKQHHCNCFLSFSSFS